MPRTDITIYDLLFSCPSDVIHTKGIISECVESFNRMFGKINNIEIDLHHWSTDSYPQAGQNAQSIINKQIVHPCDAVIAVFWTKFGTPTDKYQSGTEEEIEEMINNHKQVFLYFYNKPISPNEINEEQLKSVNAFKEKYKGLYCTVENDENFRKLLLNHLSLYFLNLISTGTKLSTPHDVTNLIVETDISDHNGKVHKKHTLDSVFMENIKNKIVEYIIDIEAYDTPVGIEEKVNESLNAQISPNIERYTQLSEQLKKTVSMDIWEKKIVVIPSYLKECIENYCALKKIKLCSRFWDVGNLKEASKPIVLPGTSGSQLYGTDEEKEKYKLIIKLYDEIERYQNYSKYLEKIDNIFMVSCYVSNKGTIYDEEVDVKLYIPCEYLLKIDSIPEPDCEILEEVNKSELIKNLFSNHENDRIEKYSGYPKSLPTYNLPLVTNPFGYSTASSDSSNLNEYHSDIKNMFCYKYFTRDDKDIVTFTISSLKQNTNMYFPTKLLFNKVPESIEYEIRSKYSPQVISGQLMLEI